MQFLFLMGRMQIETGAIMIRNGNLFSSFKQYLLLTAVALHEMHGDHLRA